MNYENLWEEVIKSAMKDPEFQWHQNMVQSAEEVYLEVCKSLSRDQKQAIEDYIAACEDLDDYLTVLAYDLGKGRK